MTVVGADGEAARESLIVERQDFWATTSNKQLNFVQHVQISAGYPWTRGDGGA